MKAGDAGSIPGSGRSLEKEMTTHCSILTWEIPWTEESGGLQSVGSQRVRHDLATEHVHVYTHTHTHTHSLTLSCLKNLEKDLFPQ